MDSKLNFEKDIILDTACAWIGTDRVYSLRPKNFGFGAYYMETDAEKWEWIGDYCYFNEATQACQEHFDAPRK